MIKRALPVVVLVLVVLFVARNPAHAATLVRHLAGQLGHVADGLGSFIARL